MAAVKTTFENHVYTFDGVLYQQKSGGPTGENLTGIVAELIMHDFAQVYNKKLSMLSLSSHILFIKIYVDNMNQGCKIIPYGSIYESGKIYIPSIGWRGRAGRGENLTDERKIQIERESEQMAKEEVDIKTIEQYSAMIYRKIANDCRPKSVVMVEDTPITLYQVDD